MNGAETVRLAQAVAALVQQAGDAILRIYATDFAVQAKDDASPLTAADLAAQDVLLAGLDRLAPGVPVLSEESAAAPLAERQRWRQWFIVDPLDGTREFVDRNGEFTVNVALVDAGQPVFGVVGVPVQHAACTGVVAARQAWLDDPVGRRPLRTRRISGAPRVIASRRHRDPAMQALVDGLCRRWPRTELVAVGSALKFALVAAGRADLYPRIGPTSQWDTAAGHALVLAAGGSVRRVDGAPLDYPAVASLLNPDFLVAGDPDFAWTG